MNKYNKKIDTHAIGIDTTTQELQKGKVKK